MTDLANAVRDARLAAGLTQAELARRTGITPSYVSRLEAAAWERGGPWPSDDVLRSLARVLHCSSTGLIELRHEARARLGARRRPGSGWGRVNGGHKYAVSLGDDDVRRAAQRLVERNPQRGSIRVASQLLDRRGPKSATIGADYAAMLGQKLAADTAAVLYQVYVVVGESLEALRTSAEQLAGGRAPGTVQNVRARVCFTPPAMLDVMVGEKEALIAVPDRRGHPFLRACLLVDDPDFVGATREWFDEFVWEPPGDYVSVRYDALDETLAAVRERLP